VSHEELQELLGAYALDAVDPDEAALVDDHLRECPRCRAEVAELREVAGLLGQSGSDAPDGVWDRIAASLAESPPPLRLEVQRERRAERTRSRSFVVAIAAVAAVVLVVLAVSVVSLRNHVNDLEQQRTDVAAAAQEALTANGSRIAHRSGDNGISAAAVVRDNGQGYFLGSGLPPLDHRIYQLWGATESGQIISLGTMTGPGVYAFSADPSVRQVMVTEENAPVPAPTSQPIAVGTLA
jgi:anti-sigma factor RsiW